MRAALVVLVLFAAFSPVHATPYWTDEDAEKARHDFRPDERPDLSSPVPRATSDPLGDFLASAWFIASMQVSDSLSADFGGIMEGEHLPDIIQTDNTSESIWVFSRYFELTGDTAILPHLDASWTYVMNFPAYSEEGGSFPATGYYRYYNCGWAVRAGMKYEQVFGDTTYKTYVDSCATYLSSNTLNLNGSPFNQRVNPPVLAWGGGNLRAYATVEANSSWLTQAANKGSRAKGWVEADATVLGTEEWAMSGGAVMWGVLESYFDANPSEEAAWVATYAAQMDTVANTGMWENAWQGWYALGEKRLEESTGDPLWGDRHLALTDYLLAFDDTDQDGGIMGSPLDLDSEDQAWVTAYLEFMCLEPLLQQAVSAPLPSSGTRTQAELLANQPNPFGIATTVPFRLDENGHAVVEVFDLTGRRLAVLSDRIWPAGEHSVAWNGRDARGRAAPSGIYFYRLRAGGAVESRKMLLIR